MFSILINGIEKKSDILFDSFSITDYINQQVDTCSFETNKFKPLLNQEIIVTIDSERVFGGVIVQIETSIFGLQSTYKITCKDYSQYMNRMLVSERYDNTTVNVIIADLIANYATDFTGVNVDADVAVTQIAFNRVTMSQALQTLADLINYYWYVDYDKDIHFFSKETELAPFNLSSEAGNHNWNSLNITDDFSQIRNQIYVVGGEYEADSRSESYIADGEQRQFPLAYKFKTITSVSVNSVEMTVGVDGFDSEDDFQVFWNYTGKYIRFKESNYPDINDVFEVVGTPLFPVIVKVSDVTSIAEYGLYEFKIIDKNIASRTDAIARGVAELQAYKDSINEGSFVTMTYGLRSGQLINVNIGDTNEDFIIQSVSMSMVDPFNPKWNVKIATTRTLGIIQFLQKYLVIEDDIKEGETLLELQQLADSSESTDSVTIITDSPPYHYGPVVAGNEARYNFATYT